MPNSAPYVPRRHWYRTHNADALIGRMVETLTDIRTGGLVIPKGARLMIVKKWGGLYLIGDRCSCCGVVPRANKVDPDCLTLLPRA